MSLPDVVSGLLLSVGSGVQISSGTPEKSCKSSLRVCSFFIFPRKRAADFLKPAARVPLRCAGIFPLPPITFPPFFRGGTHVFLHYNRHLSGGQAGRGNITKNFSIKCRFLNKIFLCSGLSLWYNKFNYICVSDGCPAGRDARTQTERRARHDYDRRKSSKRPFEKPAERS